MAKEFKNTAIFTAFDDFDPPEMATPERNLLRAVLLNAIADMGRPGEFCRKATEYFLSREEDYLYSFQSVCSYLDIDASQILILVGLRTSTRWPMLGPKAPDEIVGTDGGGTDQSEESKS